MRTDQTHFITVVINTKNSPASDEHIEVKEVKLAVNTFFPPTNNCLIFFWKHF